MTSRRKFLKFVSGLGAGALFGQKAPAMAAAAAPQQPKVVSTWEHGAAANAAAWKLLSQDAKAIDAVEAGVRVAEADPEVRTVGYGGYPDRDGRVTLDACIMDERLNCGSVAFLEGIRHPVSVARLVMEKTPHVMLVGKGALEFALDNGFREENLLTPQAETEWREWLQTSGSPPPVNIENHDTIGMLALDARGDLSGACTTSGAAYKLHGRVGDSPIIGAGLYVDNEIGAATATGMGELMMKTVGCHLVVEFMRSGAAPGDACRMAVERIAGKLSNYKRFQVGFLALNKRGEHGSFCIQPGFNYAVSSRAGNRLVDARSWL